LTISLLAGNIYGLLGKNGAGKSTLLKNISGLLFPKEGSITVNEFTPKRRLPSFLATIYFIPEEVYVPSISIESYLKLFSPFYPNFDSTQLFHYLDELDVNKDSKLNALSFGQQKKFIIAFALACNTPVLLLDEPTNGLDIPSKARFRRLIASVMNEERIIFISTHQTRDLENLIDKILIIDNGNLLLDASIDEIGQKLSFYTVKELPENRTVLFSEESFKGFSIVEQNNGQENSHINLEHLFNAVTEKPEIIKEIFSTKTPSHEPNF
jgi:ABC-2 type transport system ATP-binding protein